MVTTKNDILMKLSSDVVGVYLCECLYMCGRKMNKIEIDFRAKKRTFLFE